MAEENRKEPELSAGADKHDLMLLACLHHLAEALTEKVPPAINQEFRDSLKNASKSMEHILKPEANHVSLLGMMLEEYISAAASVMVAIAALDPLHLQTKGVVSIDEADLLQRGIEDYLKDLSILMIKKYIVNLHGDFKEFMDRGDTKA